MVDKVADTKARRSARRTLFDCADISFDKRSVMVRMSSFPPDDVSFEGGVSVYFSAAFLADDVVVLFLGLCGFLSSVIAVWIL